MPLTARQREVLEFIQHSLDRRGLPPTRMEIARELGFRSANAAEDHLRALARKGAIELTPGASRGIRLVARPAPAGQLPVIGRVAAGNPIFAEEHIEDHLAVDPAIFRPAADYLLRVVGMSMRDAGILHGDLLAVKRTRDVTSGQIVVARVNDEVTVKRFRRRGRTVRLIPENTDYATILIDLHSHSLEIEGLGVGVIRAGEPL